MADSGMAHWPGQSRDLGRELARQWFRFIGWGLICWVILFWRLGYLPLLDPDEAHYAQITREMSAAHEWMVPLLEGKPHIDKPVLFHWVQGAAFWLLGRNEFAARMPSALAALGLMALTAWFGRRLFNRQIGERAALLLATLPATVALSSVAIFDMLFAVCLFGALACLVVGALDERPRLQDLGFVLTAAAVLTKGPVAVILLAITACICFAHPVTRAHTRKLPWLRGVAIVVAVGAPWFLWMWYRFGQTFVDLYVLDNNLRLFGRPMYRRHRYPFFYGRVLLTAFLPWSLLLIGRAVDLLRRPARLRDITVSEFVLWTWFLTVVGFFSFSWFKLATYIFPAAPAMCLLAAHTWEQARVTTEDDRNRGARVSVIGVAIAVTLIGVAAALFLFKLDLPIPRTAIALPIILIAGGLTFAVQLWRAQWRPPAWGLTLILFLLAAYVTIVALGFPLLQRTRPTMDIARWVVSQTSPETPMAVYRLGRWQASLRFYSGRPITLLEDAEAARQFFAAHPSAPCVMMQKDFDQLQNSGLPLRVLYKREAVLGNDAGRTVFRRQRWGGVLVVTQGP